MRPRQALAPRGSGQDLSRALRESLFASAAADASEIARGSRNGHSAPDPPPAPQPGRPEGRLMARSLGAVLLAAPLAALVWLALPHDTSAADEPLLLAVFVVAVTTGALLVSGRLDRAPAALLFAIVTVANLLAAVAVYAAGTVTSGYVLFYLWATPYAYVFFSAQRAALQTAIAAGGLAAAFAALPDTPGSAASELIAFWFVTVLSVIFVGVLARRLTHAVRVSDDRFQRGFHGSQIGAAMLSEELAIADANGALARMVGHDPERLVGRRIQELTHPDDRRITSAFAAQAVGTGRGVVFEKRCLAADGGIVWARINMTPLTDPLDDAAFFMLVEDISERKQAESESARLARDNELILRSAGDGIFRIDTGGRITFANPACARLLGWSVEELVGRAAHELFHHTRPDGNPYPVGECPILLASLTGDIQRSSEELFWRADGTSFPVDYTSAPIREGGRLVGAVCVFADITASVQRERELRDELEWHDRIASAVNEDGLVVYGQPIVTVADRQPVAEELLVRLRSPDGSVIPPAAFLPKAERYQLMSVVDRWMLARAFALVRAGRAVAVNLSPQTLHDPAALRDLELEARSGEALERLTIEITESTAVENMNAVREFSRRARALGCRIALDDFGTGFGSFSYLRGIEVDMLKIDIDFVRELPLSRSDQRIVRTIVGIARELGLTTVAEGVETAETLELLARLGVDYAQGYLFGRPAPIEPPNGG